MSIIPLDFQRRREQRWPLDFPGRFLQPHLEKPAAGEREPADCRACQIKRKNRRAEAADLRPSPTA